MNWQTLILGNSVLIAISILAVRAIAREKYAAQSGLVISAAQTAVQYVSILLFLPFIGSINFSGFSQYWLWFLGGGLAFAFGHFFTYKLLSYLDAGLSSVLSTLYVPFTLLFAALVLHEELNIAQAAGGFVLLLAVCYGLLIARDSKHHTVKRPWLWGLIFAVLASVALAVALVNEKYLLGHMSIATYIAFGWAGQVVTSQAIAFRNRSQLKIFRRSKILYLTLTAGTTRALSGLMFISSQVKSNNVALVAISSNFRLIIIILLGAWLLKERQKLPQKLLAAGISVIGLAIIFWK